MTVRWVRAVAGLAMWACVAIGAENAGQVASLEGTADVVRGGATQPLKAGDAVFVGDKLKTAAGAKLRLLLRDDTVLTLAASTELVVNEQVLGGDQSQSSFGMLGGTLRALVPDRYGTPGSKFQVETPTAIAGVRGTGFLITYDPRSGTTTVVGLFDTTWVRGKNGKGEVTVGPQTSTEVRRGGQPRRPVKADKLRVQRLVDATDVRLTPESSTPPSGPATDGSPGVTPPRGLPGKLRPGGGGAGGAGGDGVVDQPVGNLPRRPRGPQSPGGPSKPPPPPPNVPGQSGVSGAVDGGSGGNKPPGKP